MKKVDISIIIPHFNIPNWLDRLLGTIPSRENVQVIIVDDNSTEHIDLLGKVLEKNKDHNLLFLKNNSGIKGPGACRNIGLDKADGKWILFSDADDCFTKGWYEALQPLLESEYDMVCFGITSFNERTREEGTRHKLYQDTVDNYIKDPNHKNELLLKYGLISVCNRMYSKELLDNHNIRLLEQLYAEDGLFPLQTAYYAKKIKVITDPIYCVSEREGSLTRVQSPVFRDLHMKTMISRLEFFYNHLSSYDRQIIMPKHMGARLLYQELVRKRNVKKFIEYFISMKKKDVPIFDW